MGFKSLLQTQVGKVFEILGQTDGLAPEQTYLKHGGQTYDTATRTYITSSTQYPNVPMVLARFKAEEVDDEVVITTDMKALIPAVMLPVTPSMGDKIQTNDGKVFNVERIMGVPGDSLYILHVRETAP